MKFPLFLVYLFVFLGPLGNLLTPHFFPSSFRIFYFLLPLFFVFYGRVKEKELKTLFLFLPLLLYSLISAFIAESLANLSHDASPLFRVTLLICETFFIFGAAFYLSNHTPELKVRLIRLYLSAFFLTLLLGYFFFFGYYLDIVSLKTIERFSVLTQFGYGLLRFSPGTYPNEYGIMSSFVLSILTLLIGEKRNPDFQIGFSRLFLYIFYLLTFLALILTTTRAAYLAYLISIGYLCCISQGTRRIFFKLFVVFLFSLFLAKKYFQPFLIVLIKGFTRISAKLGSFGERITQWSAGFEAFDKSSWLGKGYGSFHQMHNAYLEFFFELGLLGSIILFLTFFFYTLNHRHSMQRIFYKRLMEPSSLFFNRVIVLGLIHVFWFAASNHNINHHLTWMVFLFFNYSLFTQKKKALTMA